LSREPTHICILQFWELSRRSSLGKLLPQVLFWDFRFIPAGGTEDIRGVRRIWCLLRGPCGLSWLPGGWFQFPVPLPQSRSHYHQRFIESMIVKSKSYPCAPICCFVGELQDFVAAIHEQVLLLKSASPFLPRIALESIHPCRFHAADNRRA